MLAGSLRVVRQGDVVPSYDISKLRDKPLASHLYTRHYWIDGDICTYLLAPRLQTQAAIAARIRKIPPPMEDPRIIASFPNVRKQRTRWGEVSVRGLRLERNGARETAQEKRCDRKGCDCAVEVCQRWMEDSDRLVA